MQTAHCRYLRAQRSPSFRQAAAAPQSRFRCPSHPASYALPTARCRMKEFELMLDVDQLVRELDKDKGGSISYKEFKQIFN
jgi:hypothetical protein